MSLPINKNPPSCIKLFQIVGGENSCDNLAHRSSLHFQIGFAIMDDEPCTSQGISAEHVRASCISEATRKAYTSYIGIISKWIQDRLPEPNHYFDIDGSINVHTFTHQHFEQFLLSRVNETTKTIKVTTLSGYRSAMKHVYRTKQLAVPAEYGDNLKTLFSGLKRIEADAIQSGGARDSGKAPLNYSKYKTLCEQTLQLCADRSLFKHWI